MTFVLYSIHSSLYFEFLLQGLHLNFSIFSELLESKKSDFLQALESWWSEDQILGNYYIETQNFP